MKIDELMTRDVVSVQPEATLKEVAAILVERRISGVPVCTAEGEVLGVVSEADILHKEQGFEPATGILGRLLESADAEQSRARARTAGDAMTAPAITIERWAAVPLAARLMLGRHVNRLPVVQDGRLVGIVTRADLVRAFHRTDEEIERELVDDVRHRTLWLSPDTIEVQVEDGEVRLLGTTETRTTAGLIETLARRVPGVVDVRSELSWTIDDRARRSRRPAPARPRSV
jgi:CBS domain-containing protein